VWVEERRIDFFVGKPERKDHLENLLRLDGRRILKWLFKKHYGDVDSIDLTQEWVDGVILSKE
jgi:hypothetical protein